MEYVNSKPENDYFCSIIKKFSFNYYTNDNINISEIQQIKPEIIIIDTFLEQQSKKYFYIVCFDFKLIIFLKTDSKNSISIFFKRSDSSLYVSKKIIEENLFPITELDKKKSAILFENEIPEFMRFIYFKYIKRIPKNKFPHQGWDIICNCILGFLIRRAYLNTKFDRILYYRELINPKISNSIINKNDYFELRKLGGSNSNVSLNYSIKQEIVFTIKNNNNDLFNNELEIYKTFHHPLFPRLLPPIENKKSLVIEYLNGETLDELVKKVSISKEMKIKIIFEILIIFDCIHSRGYIYCDLKPNNIIVDENYTTYLIDFDSMVKQNQNLCCFLGAEEFVSPEISHGKQFSNKADIFSIGKIIYFLFSKEIEKNENSKLSEIMNRCIDLDQQKRPDITELIESFYEYCFSKITGISEISTIKNIKDIHSEKFIPYWLFVAEYKNPVAQYNLGEIYERGDLLPKDINKAIQYYLLSYYQKYEKSEEKLKKIFNDGEFVLNDVDQMTKYSAKFQKIFVQFIYDDQDLKPILNKQRTNELIILLLKLVKNNNSESLYALGNIYYKGCHNPLFIQKAIYYFSLAAKLNHTKAIYKLGIIYYEGKYVQKSIEKSIDFLQFAAIFNSPKAQYLLGLIYYEGRFVVVDMQKSIFYLSKAANNNHLESQFLLGSIYFYNRSSQLNLSRSIILLSAAANKYHREAQYLLGIIYYEDKYNRQNIKESIKYFTLAANCNHLESQYCLGVIYYEGKFVKQNIEESIKYLTLAANCNHLESQYGLGVIYYEGKFVKQNIEESIKYLTLAADCNHLESQYCLGVIYYEGKFVKQNIEESIKYFTLAANSNHLKSQYYLGIIYYEGKFVKQNIEESIKYLTIAANSHHLESQYYLGIIYSDGKHFDKNIFKTIKYLIIAGNKNYMEAFYRLAVIYSEGKIIDKNYNIALSYLAKCENYSIGLSKIFKIKVQILKNKILTKNVNDSKTSYNKKDGRKRKKKRKRNKNDNIHEKKVKLGLDNEEQKRKLDKSNNLEKLSGIISIFIKTLSKIKDFLSKFNKTQKDKKIKEDKIISKIDRYLGKLEFFKKKIYDYENMEETNEIISEINDVVLDLLQLQKNFEPEENQKIKEDIIISKIDRYLGKLEYLIKKIYVYESMKNIIHAALNLKRAIQIQKNLEREIQSLNDKKNEEKFKQENDLTLESEDSSKQSLLNLKCQDKFSENHHKLLKIPNVKSKLAKFQKLIGNNQNNNNPKNSETNQSVYKKKETNSANIKTSNANNDEINNAERKISPSISYLNQVVQQRIQSSQNSLEINYNERKSEPKNVCESIFSLSQAANQNDLESQYYLGMIYYEGKNVPKDICKSIFYLSLASNQNHPSAQYRLGMIYYEGKDIAKDIGIAIKYLSQAAEQNHPAAQYQLGMIYLQGDEEIKNNQRAVDFLSRAAEQNYPDALYQLGLLYYEGKHVSKDVDKSIRLLTEAAEQNHRDAMFQLGMIFYRSILRNDLEISYYYFNLSARNNHPRAIPMINLIRRQLYIMDAQYRLGIFFYEHPNVAGFTDKALHHLSVAANNHHRKAQYILGAIYYQGLIIPQNMQNAMFYLSVASHQNLREAQYKLGIIYFEGRFVPRNIKLSFYYLYLSYRQRYLLAINMLFALFLRYY